MLGGCAGCIGNYSKASMDDEDVFTIVSESEFFNDSHVFEEGVYLGYSKEYEYSFNITNNTDSVYLNYSFQYRF